MLKGERGAAKVASFIASARISAVNYPEVVSHFVHADMPEREVDAIIDPPQMTIALSTKQWRNWPATYAR